MVATALHMRIASCRQVSKAWWWACSIAAAPHTIDARAKVRVRFVYGDHTANTHTHTCGTTITGSILGEYRTPLCCCWHHPRFFVSGACCMCFVCWRVAAFFAACEQSNLVCALVFFSSGHIASSLRDVRSGHRVLDISRAIHLHTMRTKGRWVFSVCV